MSTWTLRVAKGARFSWEIKLSEHPNNLSRSPKVGDILQVRAGSGSIGVVVKEVVDKRKRIVRVAWLPWISNDDKLRREALAVCERQHQKTGLWPTLRRVHYRLFSLQFCRNELRDYKRLSRKLVDWRLDGSFPMHYVRDVDRELTTGKWWLRDVDPETALNHALEGIRDAADYLEVWRWYGQPVLPIVVYEKKAAMDTFREPCTDAEVGDLFLKGYSSISALAVLVRHIQTVMKQAEELREELQGEIDDLRYSIEHSDESYARAILEQKLTVFENDPGYSWSIDKTVILYFGDHDPEGDDIPRVAEKRMHECAAAMGFSLPDLDFRRMALNADQIEELNLPPAPAKAMSSRLAKYQAEHGHTDVWELDAADVLYLRRILVDELDSLFDGEILEEANILVEARKDEARQLMKEPAFFEDIAKILSA